MTGNVNSPALSEATLKDIRQITSKHSIWCELPDSVTALFARQRAEEFAVLARVGWPLVIGMMLLVIGVLWLQFRSLFTGWDGEVWWSMVTFLVTLVCCTVLAMQVRALQAFYVGLVGLAGTAVLATVLVTSFLFRSPLLAQETSYVIILVINVIVLALRLPLQASIATCLGGLGIAAIMVSTFGVKPTWSLVLTYYLGSLTVSFFIGVLIERHERINFLQSLLLEHESAERIRLNAVLERLASEDQLTGLANRRQFNITLHHEWERCQRNRQNLAMLFIDIDYFKRYNDTYGHSAGDHCLSAVAQGIKGSLLRPADLAARYGGEEFVVLLPETSAEGAEEVAQRILSHIDSLAIPHGASDAARHVTVSIGLALQVPDKNSTSQFLLEAADQALYQAKSNGRHHVSIYQPAVTPTPAPVTT